MRRSLLLITAVMVFSMQSVAGLPRVILTGKKGETLDGKKFDTSTLVGKYYLLIHIDPDAADLNKHVDKALVAEKIVSKDYGSVAIINAKATWIPNGILRTALKKERKKYPHTIYVLDYSKSFVNNWNFKDNSSSYMVLDKKGTPIFRRDGKVSNEDVKKLINLLRKRLNLKKSTHHGGVAKKT